MNRHGDANPSWQSRIGGIHAPQGSVNLNYEHIILWETTRGIYGHNSNEGAYNFNHLTIGASTADPSQYADGWNSRSNIGSITNSIIYGCPGKGLDEVGVSNYNCLFDNGIDYSMCVPGSKDFCVDNGNAVDPTDGNPGNGAAALKYLVRVEDGSDLDGTASDGKTIGATILKRYGVSGTFYGDTGYSKLTNEDLWPFPNENQIRKNMRTYVGPPSGKRGFCADNMTLTKYIWEYLGNEMPDTIYADKLPTPENLRIVDFKK
jgi:hypothetical protein